MDNAELICGSYISNTSNMSELFGSMKSKISRQAG